MLKRAELLEDIRLAFAVLQGYIRPGGQLHLTDINIHAEDFVCELLNITYDWTLVNANTIKPNYPCIDLLDQNSNNKIGVQVTTEKGVGKIRLSHACCAHQLNGVVDRLYVFELLPKQTSYKLDNFIKTPIFSQKNIFDFDSILIALKQDSDAKVAEAQKFVTGQLPTIFAIKKEKLQKLRDSIFDCLTLLDREVLRAPQTYEDPCKMLIAIQDMRIELQKHGAIRIASESAAQEFSEICNTLRQCEYNIRDKFPYLWKAVRGDSLSYDKYGKGEYEITIKTMMTIRDPINENIRKIECELYTLDAMMK